MNVDLRFCRLPTGGQVAFTTVGSGTPVVIPPGWVMTAAGSFPDALDWFWEPFLQQHTFVVFDRLGCGLSDRNRTDFSLAVDMQALDAVIRHLGLTRFAMFGASDGGPQAIAHAAAHPDKVSRLVLYGTRATIDAEFAAVREALAGLIHVHWQIGSKALGDMFLPGADAATADIATELFLAGNEVDVAALCAAVRAPTLVLHKRDDRIWPFRFGRQLAGLIPTAKLVPLAGEAHPPWFEDVATYTRQVLTFLAEPDGAAGLEQARDDAALVQAADARSAAEHHGPYPAGLSMREVEVLRLVAAGKSNQEIAEALFVSTNTVATHIKSIFNKTGVSNRTEAGAYAHRQRLVDLPA